MAAMGHQALIYAEPLAAPHTFDSSSEVYEFLSENVQKRAIILDTSGIRGTRQHAEERTKAGTYEVGGSFTINPSPADLDLWLPRILGAAEVADLFDVAETLPVFGFLKDLDSEQFEYTDCKVNTATFRATAGGLLELEINIMGLTEVVGPTFVVKTPGIATNNDPFAWSEAVVTLVGNAHTCMDFEVTIDNQLRRRFSNSITATDLTSGDRIVTGKFTTPYSTANELLLYSQATAGSAGTVVFTNGTITTTITLGVLQVPDVTPVVNSKDETVLQIEGIARSTGATKEIAFTNDSVV